MSFPTTPPDSSRGITGDLELAVYVKVNDDAMYHEKYTSTVVTAKRVAKRLAQEVLKLLIEDPAVKAKFVESDYLHDALCVAVQIVLYAPSNKLSLVKPGSEKLLSDLQWKKRSDWFMDDKLVRRILENSAGEMDALLKGVKLFLNPDTRER